MMVRARRPRLFFAAGLAVALLLAGGAGGTVGEAAAASSGVPGYGFFVSADGYFVTTQAALPRTRRLVIQDQDGFQFAARPVSADPASGVVLLKARGHFAALPIGASQRLRVGDPVFALADGESASLGQQTVHLVTSLQGPEGARQLFCVAGVPPVAGGPLVDAQGAVVGVLAATGEGRGCALRGEDLREFLRAEPALQFALRAATPASEAPTAALGVVLPGGDHPDGEGETMLADDESSGEALLAASLYDIGRRAHAQGDSGTARRWWRMAAERGHVGAQLALGSLLLADGGSAENRSEAVTWIQRAAEQGDATAQARLGNLYGGGGLLPADLPTARHWLEMSARQGDAAGQRELGLFLLAHPDAGGGVAEAAVWLREAARQDDPKAETVLGELHREGRGVEGDDVEAAWLFRQAAEQGDSRAQRNLAAMYLDGRGVPVDAAAAVFWLRAAGAASVADASAKEGEQR